MGQCCSSDQPELTESKSVESKSVESKSVVNPFSVYATCTVENTPAYTLDGQYHPVKVLRVVDGDTVDIALFHTEVNKMYRYRVRLYGIDTPEKRPSRLDPNRQLEIDASYRSTHALITYLEEIQYGVMARFHEADKYGRLLCTFYHPLTSESINQWMIDHGFAYAYFGKTKKKFDSDGIITTIQA